VYRGEGKQASAIQLYKELIDHPSATVPKSTAQIELARVYEETQPAEAMRLYEQVRKEDPNGAAAQVAGTTVSKADFTVGLATVKSDEDRRDQQFQGRIMDVADFPTATFTLTQPIQLPSIPALNDEVKVSATGNLTLRGVTKSVTFELTASRKGSDTIAVQGDIPITWSEWGIPEPSFGPAQVASEGEIELLLVLTR
jgi:hypothetical protein